MPVTSTPEYHFDTIPAIRHIDAPDARARWQEGRRVMFEERFHFPIEMFKGKRILDAGCGQGDLTDLLARWAGKEGLVVATDVGRVNLGKAASRIRSQPRSADDAPIMFVRSTYVQECFRPESFDIIILMNTLCYSNTSMFSTNCTQGLVNAGRMLRPGGHVWFVFMSAIGEVKPNARKFVLWLFGRNDQQRTIKWAKRLFRRSIEREARQKGLTLEERINSPYVAGKRVCFHPLGSVLKLMRRLDLHYHASYPPLELESNYNLPRHRVLSRLVALRPRLARDIQSRAARALLQLGWVLRCLSPSHTRTNPCGVAGFISIMARKGS